MQPLRAVDRNMSEPSMIGRAVMLLRAFRPEDTMLGVSALAKRTGLAKSTVHRLVKELTSEGLLEREGTAARLGLGLFELGQQVTIQRTLRELAEPYMADLREATRQTVHLSVLSGFEVVYLEILHARDAPQLGSRVGGRLPAHATASGKVVLAYSPPHVVRALYDFGLERVGPRTVTSPHVIDRELKAIRERGVAFEREESGHGVVCVAGPIIGADGVVGALSLSGWSGRMNLQRLAPAVHTTVLALSRTLRSMPVRELAERRPRSMTSRLNSATTSSLSRSPAHMPAPLRSSRAL